MTNKTHSIPHCSVCGSSKVARDSISMYNPVTEAYDCMGVQEGWLCMENGCDQGGSIDVVWKEVDMQPQKAVKSFYEDRIYVAKQCGYQDKVKDGLVVGGFNYKENEFGEVDGAVELKAVMGREGLLVFADGYGNFHVENPQDAPIMDVHSQSGKLMGFVYSSFLDDEVSHAIDFEGALITDEHPQ